MRQTDPHLLLCQQFPFLKNQQWQALGGGRTNHVWRVGGVVVKQMREGAGNLLFPNLAASEILSLQNFGKNLSPAFIAHQEREGYAYILYEFFDGIPLAPAHAELAQTLARLHQNPPIGGMRKVDIRPTALVALAEHFFKGAGAGAFCRVFEKADMDVAYTPSAPAFLHGDPVPANVVKQAGAGVRLIDWQCAGAGHPAYDLAIALSPAMNFLYGGRVPTPLECEHFLATYAQASECEEANKVQHILACYRGVKRFFHYLFWGYCLYQQAKGKGDYGKAARLEAVAFAESHA